MLERKWEASITSGTPLNQELESLGIKGYGDENKVHEFLGDFWHGNSKKYKDYEVNPITKQTFKELRENTFKKFRDLKAMGYTIVYIWESDFKNDQSHYKNSIF